MMCYYLNVHFQGQSVKSRNWWFWEAIRCFLELSLIGLCDSVVLTDARSERNFFPSIPYSASAAFPFHFLLILGRQPIGRTPKSFRSAISQLGHNISALTLENNWLQFWHKKCCRGVGGRGRGKKCVLYQLDRNFCGEFGRIMMEDIVIWRQEWFVWRENGTGWAKWWCNLSVSAVGRGGERETEQSTEPIVRKGPKRLCSARSSVQTPSAVLQLFNNFLSFFQVSSVFSHLFSYLFLSYFHLPPFPLFSPVRFYSFFPPYFILYFLIFLLFFSLFSS